MNSLYQLEGQQGSIGEDSKVFLSGEPVHLTDSDSQVC